MIGSTGRALALAVGLGIAGLLTIVLPVVAAPPAANPPLVALECLVGLAFVAGGALAPGPVRIRVLSAVVGVTWAVAAVVPGLLLAHQAGLIVLVGAFPAGRVPGSWRWVLIGLALPIGLGLVPRPVVQPLAATLFAAAAIVTSDRLRQRVPGGWYPVLSAAGIATALAVIWIASRVLGGTYDPVVAQIGYHLVVLAVAAGLPFALRGVRSGEDRLADRLLADHGLVGLEGLASILREALGDAALAVHQWDDVRGAYVDTRGLPALPARPGRSRLEVDDRGVAMGVVDHATAALDDPLTAAAVADAVRLTIQNLRRQTILQQRLADLETARARVLAAADRQRAVTAERLRGDVVRPITSAAAAAAALVPRLDNEEAGSALSVVVQELDTAADDVVALVAGIPPAELGDGRLGAAIHELVRRSPIPVEVDASPGAAADANAETALFYACSEALANAVKHGAAHRIAVAIDADDDSMSVSVADDGRGGADPNGSGLQGLADRLAARGGRLRVTSPPGDGTTVVAWVPR